ncbi:C4-dicarboxylate transporter DcuC [Vagococcus acidifermentans]|uniref:C4-dicarboxylate ABC transporter n=1 Tax=Vagococcus acidifermentans TaxID=564710 RepID=A0A430B0N9_9ENTE|nr:C4-dicarboxylate transporter DcuC [Vagococcus acidifermentans]RSU13884.1 hypothetical protein CBF27_03005 [Vagococcus acidifermentans]
MENVLTLVITFISIVIVARLILKKYNAILVFFAAGLLINLYLAIATGYSPIAEQTTGNLILDVFAFIGSEFKEQLGGVGTNLMVVAGYASLMTHIGASEKLAVTATKPLMKLNKPYLILAFLYIIGAVLKMMITSHAGLSLLLMATTFPILIRLGISKLSAASAILISGALDWGVNDGAVLFAAENVSGFSVSDYFVNYQFLPASISILTVAIVMAIYFKRIDARQGAEKSSTSDVAYDNGEKANELNWLYAILPALPLLLVMSSVFLPNMEIEVFTANVIGLIVTLLLETIRLRKDIAKTLADYLSVTFKAMGNSFANIVTLIVAASVFAKGLIQLGGITLIANQIAKFSGAQLIIIVALSLLSFFAVIILGSGNAGWYAFGPLVTDIAPKVGLEAVQIAVPMQLAAGMGRGLSPVAAAMLSVVGLAGVELESLIKRNTVPVVCGLVANIISSYLIHVVF